MAESELEFHYFIMASRIILKRAKEILSGQISDGSSLDQAAETLINLALEERKVQNQLLKELAEK